MQNGKIKKRSSTASIEHSFLAIVEKPAGAANSFWPAFTWLFKLANFVAKAKANKSLPANERHTHRAAPSICVCAVCVLLFGSN